ncbi:MAG: hypothetical protein G5663_01765 [Serratia symbiotica]|nr:hypothetical protein [Serratia symbiotica]
MQSATHNHLCSNKPRSETTVCFSKMQDTEHHALEKNRLITAGNASHCITSVDRLAGADILPNAMGI